MPLQCRPGNKCGMKDNGCFILPRHLQPDAECAINCTGRSLLMAYEIIRSNDTVPHVRLSGVMQKKRLG